MPALNVFCATSSPQSSIKKKAYRALKRKILQNSIKKKPHRAPKNRKAHRALKRKKLTELQKAALVYVLHELFGPIQTVQKLQLEDLNIFETDVGFLLTSNTSFLD